MKQKQTHPMVTRGPVSGIKSRLFCCNLLQSNFKCKIELCIHVHMLCIYTNAVCTIEVHHAAAKGPFKIVLVPVEEAAQE